MKIRKATKKDIENIYPLFLELVRSEEKMREKAMRFFKYLNRRKNNFESNSKKELLKDIRSKKFVFLVAEEGGEIVGYISGDVTDSKNPFYKPINLGYLKHIVVSKKYHGKGIGKRLNKEFEKMMKKRCDFIYLEVFSSNFAVKRFNKFGYKIATHKMWKKLK